MSNNAPFKGDANASGATPGPSFEEHCHKAFFQGNIIKFLPVTSHISHNNRECIFLYKGHLELQPPHSSLGDNDIHILKVPSGGQGTFGMWLSLSPREN